MSMNVIAFFTLLPVANRFPGSAWISPDINPAGSSAGSQMPMVRVFLVEHQFLSIDSIMQAGKFV